MKKILTFVLALCLIIPVAFGLIGCAENPTDPADQKEVWDGTTVAVSEAVEGVITIDTAEELAGVAKAVNDGTTTYSGVTLKLATDMDLQNMAWTPIGLSNRKTADAKKFSGTFDGNGKIIKGLTNTGYIPTDTREETSEFSTYVYGLFGYTENAIIKNLTVTANINCNAAALKGDSVAAIVGYANEGLTLQNCTVNGKVNGGFDAVGAFVGRSYNSDSTNKVIIENCTNNAEVTAMFKAAGILGYVSTTNFNVKVNNCTNNGKITVTGVLDAATFYSHISGIVNYGWVTGGTNTLVITNNVNNGNLYSVAELSTAQGITNYHAYAYIADSASYSMSGVATLEYDFTGNSNTGKIYLEGEEVTDALLVLGNQTYPTYNAQNEYNNKTSPAV